MLGDVGKSIGSPEEESAGEVGRNSGAGLWHWLSGYGEGACATHLKYYCRCMMIEFIGGPLGGEWVDLAPHYGVIVVAGHRYAFAREDDGTYYLAYCGELVAA